MFFSIVPKNGPALLEMPDCKRLQLLSINVIEEAEHNRGQVNKQYKQDKPKTNNKKANGLKAQPLKDFILGSSPGVNRKLLTHILTNVPTHPHPKLLHFTAPNN